MAFQNFYDLDVWKKSRAFKLAIYATVKKFPDHERFDLTSQLKRSARSIPTNISEGHGRRTPKDQLSFCVIARGSLSEVLNHLIDAHDCGYISRPEIVELQRSWDEVSRLLNGYMTFLKSQANKKSQPENNIEEEAALYVRGNSTDSDEQSERFLSILN